MRILVLGNELTRRRGGQELSLLDVCSGLASRGHEITLLYTREGELLSQYAAFCRRIRKIGGCSVDRSRTLRSATRLLTDLFRTTGELPDVIYANQYLDSFYARLLSRLTGRPFVCHLRLPPPNRFCGQYRWGMRGATRLIAISEQTRREYVSRGFRPHRIHVVYNGIDVSRFPCDGGAAKTRESYGVSPADVLFVYAGRLHPVKGVELLIDACASLSFPAHLRIAGVPAELQHTNGSRRDYLAELRQRARRRGIGDRCRFVGHRDDIAELFACADAVVLPSLWSEPFGRTLIESMACGTPAIGAATGGIPEVLSGEFAQFLFPKADVRMLALRLGQFHDWRQRNPRLGQRCREHVSWRFPLRATVAGVESVLSRTVGEWRSGRNEHCATTRIR